MEVATVEPILDSFNELQAAITRKNQESGYDTTHPWHHHLTVAVDEGLLNVEYQGEYELWFDDNSIITVLHDILSLLASSEVAPRLGALTYRTAASLAANGTYDYNIDPLIDGDHRFPNLTYLSLDQGPGETGYKILTSPMSGDDWLECGVLARMLDKAPRLSRLVTPVPPNGEFFRGPPHPLQWLDVDAAYGHENFLRELAGCERFPELRRLVFTDFRQDYMKDWRQQTTSHADYVMFFESPTAERLDSIRFREVSLSSAEIENLLRIRTAGVTFSQKVED